MSILLIRPETLSPASCKRARCERAKSTVRNVCSECKSRSLNCWTDFFASTFWPIAKARTNSGAMMACTIHRILRKKRWRYFSWLAGTLRCNDTQVHKKMVIRQLHRMSKVPRPSGWLTQPSLLPCEVSLPPSAAATKGVRNRSSRAETEAMGQADHDMGGFRYEVASSVRPVPWDRAERLGKNKSQPFNPFCSITYAGQIGS